jgi:hypothetical protein
LVTNDRYFLRKDLHGGFGEEIRGFVGKAFVFIACSLLAGVKPALVRLLSAVM